MITIHLTSGLGNQLFQLCFGEYIKKEFKDFKIQYDFIPIAPEQLNLWDVFESDIKELNPINAKFSLNYRYIKLLNFKLSKVLNLLKIGHLLNNYSDSSFKKLKLLDLNKNYIFSGYWQKKKFFLDTSKIIKKKLKFKNKLAISDLLPIELKKKNFIGLHIRGGDYLKKKNQKTFNNIDYSFYENSINYLNNIIKNPLYIVFTDDYSYANKILKTINFPHIYIKNYNDNPSYDFQLLSHCHHFIIPNSTFSWWAAFFSKNNYKKIISPRRWFINNNENFDL